MSIGLVRVLGLTLSSLSILGAAGCAKSPPRALFTVAYYQTNENVRHEKLKECRDNADKLRGDPDCINAERAEGTRTAAN